MTNLLFIGDIFGSVGRGMVARHLPEIVVTENIHLSIAGGNKTIRGLANLLGFSIEKEGTVTSFKPDAPPAPVVQPDANPATVFRPNYSGLPDGYVTATPPAPRVFVNSLRSVLHSRK